MKWNELRESLKAISYFIFIMRIDFIVDWSTRFKYTVKINRLIPFFSGFRPFYACDDLNLYRKLHKKPDVSEKQKLKKASSKLPKYEVYEGKLDW